MNVLTILEIVLISYLFIYTESKEINCLHLQQEECSKHKDICFLANVNSCCEKDFLMCLPISSKYCETSTEELFSNKLLKKSPPSNTHEWCLKKKKSILRFNTSCVPEIDSDSEYFKPNLYKCKFSKCQKGFKCIDEPVHKKCETENNSCCKYESKCVPTKDINQLDGPIFKNPKGQLAETIFNSLNPDSQFKDKPIHENDKKKKHNNDKKDKKNSKKNNNKNNKLNNEINQGDSISEPLDRIINDQTPIPWNLKNSKQQQHQQQQKQIHKFNSGSPYPVLPPASTTHLNTIEPTTFTSNSIRFQLKEEDIKNDEKVGELNNEEQIEKKKKKNKNKKKNKKTKKPKTTKKPTTEKPSKKPKVTEQPEDDPSIEITEEPTITPTIPPTLSPVHEDPCKRASCPIGSHCLVYGNQAYCKLDKPPTFPSKSPLPTVKKLDTISMFYTKSKMLLREYTSEDKSKRMLSCSTISCQLDEVCVSKEGMDPYCKLKPPPSPNSYNKSSCNECPTGSFRCNPNPNENTPLKCYPKLICPKSTIPNGYFCISDPIRGGYFVKYESQINLSCETLLCQGSNSYCSVAEKGPICKTWPNDTIQYKPSCDKCPKDTMSCMTDDNNKNRVVCRIDRPSCSVIKCPTDQYCVNTEKGPTCYKRSIECSNSRCPKGYSCIRDEFRGGSCLKDNE
ncbi:hypothetical protein RB653_008987 [Dictyostelium firmibasis]|uniref:Follistatin-like domain-containing protein n=1 Tax=Dictyostelium firmibasis TaxID=79012 RepID=A0AAN7YUG5_9MYCE